MQQEVYLSERKRFTNRLEVQGQQRQNVMTYFWHCSVLINCTYSSNLLKYWLVQGTIFLYQAYTSELQKFLSQAQHPKVIELLQSALDKCKSDATRAQPVTAQPVKAKPKSDKPSMYLTPITSYGMI